MSTTILKRLDKGVALTYAEMDTNLENLRTATDAYAADLGSQVAIIQAGQTAGMLGYATKAAMDADLAHVAGTTAIVTNDASPTNNTFYLKLGGSGTGSWQQSAMPAQIPIINASIYADLATAISAQGSTPCQLIVSASMAITADTTIPSTIDLSITGGGTVAISAGKVLTINGKFSAGMNQVFTGSGNVSGLRDSRPEWFGTNTTPGTTDMTTAFTKAVTAASSVIGFAYTIYRVGSIPLKSNIVMIGNGAVITSMTAADGNFTGTGIDNIVIDGWEFRGVAGTNYEPVIQLDTCTNIGIRNCYFNGVGFGVSVLASSKINMAGNKGQQIGIYPRPAGSGADFNSAYNHYGAFLFTKNSSDIIINNNQLYNNDIAAGHYADITGGPGGIVASICDRVTISNNIIHNAPGQGICVVGDYQATTVPADIIAGTLDKSLNGQHCSVIGNVVDGSNQEGITLFGVGNGTVSGNTSRNNRMTSIEVWDSWDVTVTGNVTYEPSTADMATLGLIGAVSPIGSMDMIKSYGVVISNNIVQGARGNGICLDGSYNVIANGNIVRDYGLDDSTLPYYSSGIIVNANSGVSPGCMTISGNTLSRVPMTNNAGFSFYQGAVSPANSVSEWGNTDLSGTLTFYPNQTYWSGMVAPAGDLNDDKQLGIGNVCKSAIRYKRIQSVNHSVATEIFDLTPRFGATSHINSVLLMINGVMDANGSVYFTDLVLAVIGATPVVVASTYASTPTTRTYTISSNKMKLTLGGSYPYSIRATALDLVSASVYIGD